MSRRSKEKEGQTIKTVTICIVVLGIGYYVLNHISNRERPPLGNTFYIVTGCTMIAVSVLMIFVTLKRHFFPKKRRSKSRHVFLDNKLTKKK